MSTIKTFGQVDERSLEQLERCMEAGDAEFGVLCADHHPGYSQPIGGGIAYEGHVSPSGVGYDIGCGNKAARTELTRADLDALGGVEAIMREITGRISFGMGVPARERVDHPVLEKIRNADFAPQRTLAAAGRVAARHGRLRQPLRQPDGGRAGPDLGRRALRIARLRPQDRLRFLALAEGKRFGERAVEGEMDSPPVLFEVGSELGDAYVAAMEVAGEYAYAGRDVVVAKVLEILGAEAAPRGAQPPQLRVAGGALRPHVLGDPEGLHARAPGPGGLRRRLDGRRVGHPRGRRVGRERAGAVLHRARRRPGDEPLAGGRAGSAGASAGPAAHRDCPYVGGRAGHVPRARVEAPQGVDEEQVKPGLVDWPAVQARLREQGIVLVGGGADEAPEVYKRLPDVLAAHGDTIRVKHTLRPLGVAMAGRDVYDPYKD